MVALRSSAQPLDADDGAQPPAAGPNPHDWLSVAQAACELGVSASTVRRRIHDGLLRSHMVPRTGGFAYRVYLPESRHGRDASLRAPATSTRSPKTPIDLSAYRRRREQLRGAGPRGGGDGKQRRLEGQPERLPEALMQVLHLQPTPFGAGLTTAPAGGPFEQYRQLVRKRRWWPF